MASLMENLIEVLDKESLEYENLLGLSEAKTPVIVSGDLEKLAQITDEEQLVVSRINHLDQKRQEVFKDIANVINKDVKTLKITDLIHMLESSPEEQQNLAKAYDKLHRVVSNVATINQRNAELIKSMLEMVEFDMNMLQAMKSAPATANYDRTAYNAGNSIGIDASGFDAKQ